MVQFDPKLKLPTSAELPCSDDTPVDNENQNLLPNILLFLLKFIWAKRNDWFFGVDMGVYHTTGISPLVPVVPDGFLSLGVERHKDGDSRKSYVLWEENDTVPIFVLEIVSLTYGGEYDTKAALYAKLGVLYYLVYNPQYWQRDCRQPFELYRLENGRYQQQIGEPFWMPEVGLGIGRSPYQDGSKTVEALYWFDQQGNRYLTPEEQLERYRQHFGDLPAV
ncbi:MAG: Uma2 family endonuclease [Leptolyngbya sp. BL-A-14]